MKSMKYPHGKVALFKDRKVIYHLFSDCIVLSPVKSPRFMVKLVKLTNFDPKKCGNLLAKSRKMSTFSSLAANSNAWRVSFFSTHGGPVGWENVDLSHISPISIGCLKMLDFNGFHIIIASDEQNCPTTGLWQPQCRKSWLLDGCNPSKKNTIGIIDKTIFQGWGNMGQQGFKLQYLPFLTNMGRFLHQLLLCFGSGSVLWTKNCTKNHHVWTWNLGDTAQMVQTFG